MTPGRTLRRGRPPRPHRVARVDEIPPGGRLIVAVEGRSIGVFNVRGTFHALRNLCPHQGAPLCEGPLAGTTLPSRPGEYILGREGEILRCPWHGWEFDVTTGASLFDPRRCRVRAYPVTLEGTPESASPPPEGVDDPGLGHDTRRGLSAERYPVTVEGAHVVVHV